MLRYPLLLAAALAAGTLRAADEMPLEGDFFADMPVIVTGSRLPQTPDTVPASVTVIDRATIDASGATALVELLRLVPGFQVGHVSGTRTAVTYHGVGDMYSRRMQVLIDGRSVYLPATGGVDWLDLPLAIEDVERVEVIRGPNGVSYGSNSFLAVVNVVTRHPADTHGQMVRVVRPLSGGERRSVFRLAEHGADLDLRLTLAASSGDGSDSERGYVDGYDNRMLNLRGEFRPSINDYLGFQAGLDAGPRQTGYTGSSTEPARDRDLLRHFQYLHWKRLLSAENEFNLRLSHTYSDDQDTYLTPPYASALGVDDPLGTAVLEQLFDHPNQPLQVVQDVRNERFDAEFEHRFAPHRTLRAVWGGGVRLDRVQLDGFTDEPGWHDNRVYRLFGNLEWLPAPQWVVNAGVLAESDDMVTPPLAPRLAVNLRLDPAHTLRAGWTRAYRAPTVFEEHADYAVRFADGVPLDQLYYSDGGLTPETMEAVELGLRGRLQRGRIVYDVKLFRERLRDLIAAVIDRQAQEPFSHLCPLDPFEGLCWVTGFENGGWADVQGVEIETAIELTERTRLRLALSHADADGELPTDANPDEALALSQTTPTTSWSVQASHRFADGWQLAVSYFDVAGMQFVGGDSHEGYRTADVVLAKRIDAGWGRADVGVTARNVLGGYFDFHEWTPQERQLALDVSVQY